VLFWLYKSKKNKHGLIPIYIRLALNKTKIEIASGYFIPSSHWNDKKKHVIENTSPQRAEINNALQIQKAKILSIYNQLLSAGNYFKVETIKARLSGKEEQVSLLKAVKYHNDKMKLLLGKSCAVGAFNNYIYFTLKLKSYLKDGLKVNDILIQQLNHQFIVEFEHYLKTVAKK